jgi:hypothetical protein
MINSRGEVVTPEELDRGVIFDEGFPVQVRRTDRQRRFDAVLPHKAFWRDSARYVLVF